MNSYTKRKSRRSRSKGHRKAKHRENYRAQSSSRATNSNYSQLSIEERKKIFKSSTLLQNKYKNFRTYDKHRKEKYNLSASQNSNYLMPNYGYNDPIIRETVLVYLDEWEKAKKVIGDLRNQVNELNDERNSLEKAYQLEVDNLSKENDTVKHDNESLKIEVDVQKNYIIEIKKKYQALQQENTDLKNKIIKLKQLNLELTKQNRLLEIKVNEANTLKNEFKQQVTTISKQYNKMLIKQIDGQLKMLKNDIAKKDDRSFLGKFFSFICGNWKKDKIELALLKRFRKSLKKIKSNLKRHMSIITPEHASFEEIMHDAGMETLQKTPYSQPEIASTMYDPESKPRKYFDGYAVTFIHLYEYQNEKNQLDNRRLMNDYPGLAEPNAMIVRPA